MKFFKKRVAFAAWGAAIVAMMVMCPFVLAAPGVSHVTVTDVTPVSFSVIWISDEASTSNLNVFSDEGGTVPVTGVTIESQPVESGDSAIATAAEDNGVMKVRVSGLAPDTLYYFQAVTTSKAAPGEVTLEPASVPLPGVTTESSVQRAKVSGSDDVPFTNDLIRFDCYLLDGTTEAPGALLVAGVAGGHYPITGFVGDGVAAPSAYVDLNNLFSSSDYRTKSLAGGEVLTLTRFLGQDGVASDTFVVPTNNQLAQMKLPQTATTCSADLDTDGDVDGNDLLELISDLGQMSLADFAAEFGRVDCL